MNAPAALRDSGSIWRRDEGDTAPSATRVTVDGNGDDEMRQGNLRPTGAGDTRAAIIRAAIIRASITVIHCTVTYIFAEYESQVY